MAAMIDLDRLYTPEEMLALPDAEHYELVDGRLKMPNASALSAWVEGRLYCRIDEHVASQAIGWAFTSGPLYRCFPHRPRLMRKPDVSFLRAERFSLEDLATQRIITIAPDLAVEVISPNDEAQDLEGKVHDYLRAGVRLVWLVFPLLRCATVRRAEGPSDHLDEDGRLDGEDVLPGLSIRLGDVLPPPLPPRADGGDAVT